MKRVFANQNEVCHVWAQQNHPDGRCNGNVFFEGDTIYSFGRHFPMARFYTHEGKSCILFTTRGYTNTTSYHLGMARNAIRGLDIPIFDVLNVDRAPNADEVIQQYRERMEHLILKAARAIKRGPFHLASALAQSDQFNAMAKFFGWTVRLELAADSLDAAKQAVADALKKAKATEAARLAALAQSEIDNAFLIEQWRACLPKPHGLSWKGPQLERTLLRINGDQIETSRHACIPVEHAKRLWPYILKRAAPSNTAIGHYNVRDIKPNGDLIIGCHHIEFREVELIAKQLGLTS